MGDAMKTCTRCGETKDRADFHKNSRASDGLATRCKPCKSIEIRAWASANSERKQATNKEWSASHRENRRASSKAWYDANTEKANRKHKEWVEANAEKISASKKEYRKENSEKTKANIKSWMQSNAAKVRANIAKRRADTIRATPSWANAKAIESIYEECVHASKLSGRPHHVDHIVPLRSKLVCGLHWEGNLAVITDKENITKGNRWWPDMPD